MGDQATKDAVKATPYAEYMKANPTTVLFSFQPEAVVVAETPRDLRLWEKLMRDNVGLPPLQAGDSGVETQTRCDGPLGQTPCDCDYDPYPTSDP